MSALGQAVPVIAMLVCAHTAFAQDLVARRVASGLDRPIFVTAPVGDESRLFIVGQRGVIRILNLSVDPPALLPGAFLNIDSLSICCGERGLLGMAFDPDYATSGHFYLHYVRNDGTSVIVRYAVSADPNVADPDSEVVLKSIEQPSQIHKAGCLQFGPDGFLYAAIGDGGPGNDPDDMGQNPGTLLGKILRLDVNSPPDYVPASNPFVGPGDPLDEIWAMGLRNPWRFSFDRLTGDLYIADVGQEDFEEINFTPAGSAGGENYGWRCYEADAPFNLLDCLPPENYQFPIHSYPHDERCAVMGGYVYRGTQIPELSGTYFFSDICAGIYSLRVVDGVAVDVQDRTDELDPPCGTSIGAVASFGEDAAGELYLADVAVGQVFKIVVPDPPTLASADPPDGFYDARADIAFGSPAGPFQFQVTFAAPVSLCLAGVSVTCPSGFACPTPTLVFGSGAGPYSITLSAPIPPGACTTLTFPSASPQTVLHYSFLPGDASLNGRVNTQDLLTLIQALNGGMANQPGNLPRYDMNRSGFVDTQDLLRLIQLLNGVNSAQAWNGVTLAGCL